MKKIIIAADGTWNRPEKDPGCDYPTNVLKIARAISPLCPGNLAQMVFYDWGLGSYHDNLTAGGFGRGIDKNIMDCYRFLVHNYKQGDEIFLFGFSRGAYTVRSLAGLINNCSILTREHANQIEPAFSLYKDPSAPPRSPAAMSFKKEFSHLPESRIRFIGVWDTVGALGIPLRMLGLLSKKHLFYDNKIGSNIDIARHALALDECRKDFKPTIWRRRKDIDLKQLWFAGVHSDVGGSYPPDPDGSSLADIPLQWIMDEAEKAGLALEPHLRASLRGNAAATAHEEYDGFYKLLGRHQRHIPKHTDIHPSIVERWQVMPHWRPPALRDYTESNNNWNKIKANPQPHK